MSSLAPARLAVSVLCAALAWGFLCGAPVIPAALAAQPQKEKVTKPKRRAMHWHPPEISSPLKSTLPAPACLLPQVLRMAGENANLIYKGLNSFTAREEIQFKVLNEAMPDEVDLSYDFEAFYKTTPSGLDAHYSRNIRSGFPPMAGFDPDTGMTGMALIFLPEMQTDYEFTCEGTVRWNGQPAWVLHFQQRKDQPRRTMSLISADVAYLASLQGRAWIAADSGEIQHMETNIDGIPELGLLRGYISIHYAPVVYYPAELRKVLPQTVDTYGEFKDHRTMEYHTFSDYHLFTSTATIKLKH